MPSVDNAFASNAGNVNGGVDVGVFDECEMCDGDDCCGGGDGDAFDRETVASIGVDDGGVADTLAAELSADCTERTSMASALGVLLRSQFKLI